MTKAIRVTVGTSALSLGLIAFGVAAMFFAALFEAAPEGTYNIGLLQKQMMIFQFGGLCALSGVILYSATLVGSHVKQLYSSAAGER
jgi:hypothetical protein